MYIAFNFLTLSLVFIISVISRTELNIPHNICMMNMLMLLCIVFSLLQRIISVCSDVFNFFVLDLGWQPFVLSCTLQSMTPFPDSWYIAQAHRLMLLCICKLQGINQYMYFGLKTFFGCRVEGSFALYKFSCYVFSSAIISAYGSAHYNTDSKLMNFS